MDKLLERIESYNFECEVGPLANCVDWQKLKELFITEIRAALNPLREAQLCKAHGRFPCRECGTKHFAGCQCSFCRPTKEKDFG